MAVVDNDPYFDMRANLIRDLYSPDPDVISRAIHELSKRNLRRGISLRLVSLLRHESDTVRSSAAEAVGKFNMQPAVKWLIKLLIDRNQPSGVRCTAAHSLGLLGSRSAIEPLKMVSNYTNGRPDMDSLNRSSKRSVVEIEKRLTSTLENLKLDHCP